MASMRTSGPPRCLRASGCRSCCTHLCSATIMSQVRSTGGDSMTCCWLLPMLISFIGAGVPHSVPSRQGVAGTATTSRPFSRTAQRACASSISCADHSSGCPAAGRRRRVVGLLLRQCWRSATVSQASAAPTRCRRPARKMRPSSPNVAESLTDLPLLPAPGPADYAPTNRNPEVADLKQIYIAPICGKREAFAVARLRMETTCGRE